MNAATLSGPNNTRSMTPAMKASHLLGWVSFAIGAAELLAPRRVARAVGLEGNENLLRAYGARELAAGVGAHSVYPVPALWSRVAGDLLDIGTLAYAGRRPDGGMSRNTWTAIGVVAGITAIDLYVAATLAAETKEGKNVGEPKDYSSRSGFPRGVQAAHGAGIVDDAMAGKAGGAAAGDSSPAGRAVTGQSSTDLNGAPPATGSAGQASTQGSAGVIGGGGGQSAGQAGGVSGKVQTMPAESREVVPEPPAYSPT